MRCDRIVWSVCVIRVVSCAFVFVCISTCVYPCCGPDRITLRYVTLRYVTLGSYVRYVLVSCVRYVFVRVHTA